MIVITAIIMAIIFTNKCSLMTSLISLPMKIECGSILIDYIFHKDFSNLLSIFYMVLEPCSEKPFASTVVQYFPVVMRSPQLQHTWSFLAQTPLELPRVLTL